MRSFLRSRTRTVPTIATLLLLAGCSTSPISPEQHSGQSQAFAADPTVSNAGLLSIDAKVVSGTVDGALGGVLRNGDWTVKIPAGSFAGTGLVTVTVPDPGVRSCDLKILPGALNSFRAPVTLSCRLHGYDEVRDYQMEWWNPNTNSWTTVPSTTSSKTMSCDAPLTHFSTYRCGKAGW